MKNILILFLSFLINTAVFSQKKYGAVKVDLTVADISRISKNDKWIKSFTIKKKIFNVYCGFKKPDYSLRQEVNDTLEVYKVSLNKEKYSQVEITKFATRKGKIIKEGFYKINNDTLTVATHFYDYIGAYRITDKYIVYKYGLKKVSDEMQDIDNETLSDRYIKTAEDVVPFVREN